MKATGIVRRIDELGRLVLPKELRKKYAIGDRDAVEIFTDDKGIYLQKYCPGQDVVAHVDNLSKAVDNIREDLGTEKEEEIRECLEKVKDILESL